MKNDTIPRKNHLFSCDICSIAFPTNWQLERHVKSDTHHRVARAAKGNNNYVVAPKTSSTPGNFLPQLNYPIVASNRANVPVQQFQMPSKQILLYSVLVITLLYLWDNSKKHNGSQMTTINLNPGELSIPTGIAGLIGCLALLRLVRTEANAWVKLFSSINKNFSNWGKG